MKRSILSNVVRILISVGLLYWVLSRSDLGWADIARSATDLRWELITAAFGLSFLGIVIRAYRWKWLIESVGARLSARRAIYLYFVGQFFNSFLPTGFGGDVVRVLEVGRGASSQEAAGTALVDRLSGFITLFGIALVLVPFSLHRLPAGLVAVIAGSALLITAGAVVLFEGRLVRWGLGLLPKELPLARGTWADRAYQKTTEWVRHTFEVIASVSRPAIAVALAASVVFNVVHVWANALIAWGLGIHVAAVYFFLFIPIATVALLAPAVSGFGVREGLYVALFATLGLTDAQAIALSLSSFLLDFAPGLFGGGLYVLASLLGLRAPRQEGAVRDA